MLGRGKKRYTADCDPNPLVSLRLSFAVSRRFD